MVHFSDGQSVFFNIIVGVLQGDTLAPNMVIIGRDNVSLTLIVQMKENGFKL